MYTQQRLHQFVFFFLAIVFHETFIPFDWKMKSFNSLHEIISFLARNLVACHNNGWCFSYMKVQCLLFDNSVVHHTRVPVILQDMVLIAERDVLYHTKRWCYLRGFTFALLVTV